MTASRREFLRQAAGAGLSLAVFALGVAASARPARAAASTPPPRTSIVVSKETIYFLGPRPINQ
jgi:hypothetical protein